MTPVLLIASNFVRQHRWPVLLLFLWIVLSSVAVGDLARGRPVSDDVVFYLQQQSLYICVFTAFLAADAIHSERKSRRILLLLSKAVNRGTYLLSVLLATWSLAIAYALVSALCGVWLAARSMLPSGPLWSLFVVVVAGALISAAAAVFFTTFLNPYLATGCTLALFCSPGALHAYHYHWAMWLPGFPLVVQMLRFSFKTGWAISSTGILAAIGESALFWAMAAAIFGRRDISVPIE